MHFDKQAFFQEYEQYYSKTSTDTSATKDKWLQLLNDEQSPFVQKKMLYLAELETCKVHLFKTSPFYYVIEDSRPRNMWGMTGVGALMRERNWEHTALVQPIIDAFREEAAFVSWQFIDWDHQCAGYDNILQYGLECLRQKALVRLETVETTGQKEFLEAAIVSMECLIAFANRHADLAEEMLKTETDPDVVNRLTRISQTARKCPAQAPTSFYEALNSILFYREACSGLEGIGVSIYGQLDRMLAPYYESDLAAGAITPEEAYYLIKSFMAITDARFDLSNGPETSTTVNIGGMDREGKPVFNDITEMICRSIKDLHLSNPKLNAHVCADSPKEYVDLLADLTVSETNILAVFADETNIAANVRIGKSLEDSRLGVNGGCQEPVLQNTESNFRATIYVNLLKPLQLTMHPEKATSLDLEYFKLTDVGPKATTFDEFYQAFKTNLSAMLDSISAMGAVYEAKAVIMNPSPMLSCSVDDCLSKAVDILGGGARYNTSGISLNGMGSLLDSLMGIKKLVFDDKVCTMDELRAALDADYVGYEYIQDYVLRRVPKYGEDTPELNDFTAMVGSDVADAANGQPNGRGGKFEATLFTYTIFKVWGSMFQATPDGRKSGQYFTRGMSPAEKNAGVLTSVLNAASTIPMEKYAGGGVLDINLPAGDKLTNDVVSALIYKFVQDNGSILQLSAIDKDVLLKAQSNPEAYPNLIVRVAGYSAYFNILEKSIQDEIINRAVV